MKPGLYCGPPCRARASLRRRTQAAERRNRGKAVAAANHREHLELARRLALEVLAVKGAGTISDVRERADELGYKLPWHLPWTANVFLGAEPRWFEPTGRRLKTTHVRGNARKVNEYRLSELGRSVWRKNSEESTT